MTALLNGPSMCAMLEWERLTQYRENGVISRNENNKKINYILVMSTKRLIFSHNFIRQI